MIALRIVIRLISVITLIILARILAPTAYGLVAIGTLAVSFVNLFTELGFKQALVQEAKNLSDSMLNTAWTVEIFRGIFVFFAVYLSADWISRVFNAPASVNIIRALALTVLINGFTNIRIILVQKELDFRKQFIYEFSGVLGPLLIGLPLVFILKNVWAIVFGTISGALFQLISSYFLVPSIPKIGFGLRNFLHMVHFGKWIFLGGIVSYIAMELDTYAVGKIFQTDLLGLYVVAFNLSNQPVIEIGKSLSKVLFPAFAKIANDELRSRRVFLDSIQIIYLAIIPASIGISAVSSDFTMFVLGEKWYGLATLLRILAIGALARGLAVTAGSYFLGIGKPRAVFLISSSRAITFIFALVILMQTPTLENVGLAVLLANIVNLIFFLYFLNTLSLISVFDWLRATLPIILASCLMLFSIFVIHLVLDPGLLRLATSIILGAGVNIGTIILMSNWFGIGPLKQVKTVFKSLFRKKNNFA